MHEINDERVTKNKERREKKLKTETSTKIVYNFAID